MRPWRPIRSGGKMEGLAMEPARESTGQATALLRQMSQGDRRAADDLHALARQAMAGKAEHTLQPTALVHEACLRLLAGEDPGFSSRAHFLGVAAKAMRSILVDSARKRGARKRGGDQARVPLESLL